MRRTAGWVLGICVSIGLTGVAGAALPEGTTPAAQRPAPLTGRQQVGTVTVVDQVLGYLESGRSRTFRYPGAGYVKVHFSRLLLLPGDYLTVADAKGQDSQRYDTAAFAGITEAGGRWAMSVDGDTAVVTLHLTRPDRLGLRQSLGGLGVKVDKVAHGFTPTEQASAARPKPRPKRTGRQESVCGSDEKADAVCYKSSDPTAYYRSKAVARLLINGAELCTAWRVGTGNRMLTNNHCFATSADAHDTEVWFNYMCAVCGGYEVFRSTKVWADTVLATSAPLDYTLFTVSDFAAIQKFGYLELDLRRPAAGEELYIPQHPAGQPTQVAMGGNCGVDNPHYDGYQAGTDISYYCDTEGGSSGSPVLSKATDKVLAIHHFGGCPNSAVGLDLIYQEISKLL